MTPEEIEEVFREYNEAVIRGTPIEESLARRMQDANAGLDGYTAELEQSLRRLKTSSIGLAQALKNGQSGSSIYNDTIESGADALSSFLQKFGPLGKLVGLLTVGFGKLVSDVNQQTDALFETYQNLNRFGAGVTTGLDGVLAMSQQMGFTVENLQSFTSVLERSSRELGTLGGTVATGSTRFAQLIKDVDSQREMWRRLGLDVEQQNEAYSGFIRIMTISGRAQRLTGDELATASQGYVHNLVLLSKLTGQTVEELNSQREAFMAQQRFLSVQRDLERQAREATARGDHVAAERFRNMVERNRMIIDSVPKELQTGVADAMTGFLGTSEESIKLLRSLPEFAQMLASQNFEYGEAMSVAEREAGQVLNNFAGTLGAAGAFDETFGSLAGFVKLESAALAKTFPERIALAETEIATQKAQQGAVADQAKLREAQLRTAQDVQSLIGLLRGPVTKGMQGLATITGEVTTAMARFAGVAERGAAPGAGAGAAPTATPSAAPAASTLPAPAAAPTTASPAAARPATATPAAVTVAPSASTATTNLNVVNLPDMSGFAQGGIATGPTSGYQAMLNGVEAVVPLGNNRTIPVQMPDMSMGFDQQQQMLDQQMILLTDLVKETRANNQLTERLLKIARS